MDPADAVGDDLRALRGKRLDAEVKRLVAAGASVFRINDDGADYYGVVMQDPEGNEFCVS